MSELLTFELTSFEIQYTNLTVMPFYYMSFLHCPIVYTLRLEILSTIKISSMFFV